MAKTYKATVVVAQREGGHPGWFSGGKFWASGQHEDVELTEEQANDLARRPGIAVLVGGKVVQAKERTGPPRSSELITDEERGELERFRRERAKAKASAEDEEGGLEFSSEKRGAAFNRIASTPGPGTTALGTAAAPLEDADILKGAPPPENAAANVKPLEPAPKRK